MTWVLMAVAIVIECMATVCLRLSEGLARPLWLVPSALGYIATFILVSMVLQRGWTMALTYGVWAAGGIALLALAGAALLDEKLQPSAVVGLFLTMAGIALMQHGSNVPESGAKHEPPVGSSINEGK